MTITTLKAAPHLKDETLKLIEASFHYESQNKFVIDFAPLMHESNLHNCFIMLSENGHVCAHIGVCDRYIDGIQIALLGGIAVAESHRGGGKFQELMMEVLSEKKSDVAFFVLWSDKEKLYQKYGFHLCGSQYQTNSNDGTRTNYEKTKYDQLSLVDKKIIQSLYQRNFGEKFFTVSRTESDWEIIGKITSSDLFIKRNNSEIISYYFQNKGQDLNQIIFEYGTQKELNPFLNEIAKYDKIWSPIPVTDNDEEHYQFMLCPGNTKLFSQLVDKYTKGRIVIREINSVKQEVYFQFEEDLLGLDMVEFLRGVFGPQAFEELGEIRPIFFSGLDSI